MKSKKALGIVAAAALATLGMRSAKADTIIAQWTFPATQSAPYNSPPTTTGTGTAVSLGMTNSYTYAGGETTPTTTNDDVVSTSGTAVPAFTENLWRIRGFNNKSGQPGNGWNNSAPNYTQGAAFEVPTSGYTPTTFTFDWYSTTQGVANMQVLYTLDDSAGFTNGVANAGMVWTPIGSDLIATSNDYYGGAGSSPTNTISLSGLPAGATNDPNFAIELVSVRPVPTDPNYVAGDPNYQSAAGGDYNNSSGNWRFGNITLNGTAAAVPEPATIGLLGLAGISLLSRRRHASK